MTLSNLPVRNDDPDTSIDAALKAAMGASHVRPVVLQIIKDHGPLTHDQIRQHYQRLLITQPDTPRASESGIRTRVSELVRANLVAKDTEEGQSVYGNRAKRWVAIDPASVTAPVIDATVDADLAIPDSNTQGGGKA